MAEKTAEKITRIDLRDVPVFERHPMIFDTWEEIEPEATLQIINDHDPKPLQYQFEGEHKDSYSWEYVSREPMNWVVNIRKLRVAEATGAELRRKVEDALDEIRPYLQADGGDVELMEIDEAGRTVRVRLAGACGGCPSSAMTLKAGVEKTVRKHAPGIRRVEAI